MKLKIVCDGIACGNDVAIEIEAPKNWSGLEDDIEVGLDGSRYFCPKCKLQDDWFSAVCSGCVAGFGECDFSSSFMYDYKRNITEVHLETIGYGFCPFRVNGTMMAENTGGKFKLESIDISDRAAPESGKAIVEAVKKYIEKYP